MAKKSGAVQKVEVVKPIPRSPESAADKKREDEWRAEDDARTLLRAAEIKGDKARFAKARAWAKKRVDEMRDIAGITG